MSEMKKESIECPICRNKSALKSPFYDGNIGVYQCDYCGNFSINEWNSGINSNNYHLIAGYLYETKDYYKYDKNRVGKFNKETTEKLLASPEIPKTSMQRLDKLLLNIYNMGKDFNIVFDSLQYPPQIAYAKDKFELYAMIRALVDLGYLRDMGVDAYGITIQGLQHAEELLSSRRESNKAFIAMRFSDEMMKARDEGIKPACEACGFNAITVNEKEHNDDITDRIIAEIKTSRFVIADFTENNQGVYYEAGFAKGLGIPVIKTCKKEWFDKKDDAGNKLNKLHFDIEHDNLILWENEKDLATRLEARIRATIF